MTQIRHLASRILEGRAQIQKITLDWEQAHCRIDWGFDPSASGDEQQLQPCAFVIRQPLAAACWTYEDPLPPELWSTTAGSPGMLSFLASLFSRQWVYEWELFTHPGAFLQHRPTWLYGSETDLIDRESIFLFWERPGAAVAWSLGISYQELQVEAEGQLQTLEDFVGQWQHLLA